MNGVQVSNFGENCACKFYLHMALPAHCSGKITYALFRVYFLNAIHEYAYVITQMHT